MDPKRWLQNRFSEYYKKNRVRAPPDIARREFGAGIQKKIDFRHLSFSSEQELSRYLEVTTPLYISYSAAHYDHPSITPMEAKRLRGADLIFDFDLGDLPVNCDDHMPTPECLNLVKGEVVKLIEDFLIPDFGFSRNEILVFFSGNKGYHIHIRSDSVQDLDQRARMEIVDYVSGVMNPMKFLRIVGKSIHGPKPDQCGWGGRFARRLIDILENRTPEEARKILGVSVKKVYERKDQVIAGIKEGIWDQAPVSREKWSAILQSLALEMSVKLDRNVTIDMARLIRLPTSLHGSSGLIVNDVGSIDKFRPLDDAIVFGRNYVRVDVKRDISFYLGGDQEIKKGEQELPEFVAVYLVGKGEAIPLD